MRPVLLSDAREEIQRCVAYAEAKPMTHEEMLGRPDVRYCPAGAPLPEDDPERLHIPFDKGYECYIPVGIQCVFTIEEQPAPLNWCRHLSIRLTDGKSGARIHPVIANLIMQEFGFRNQVYPLPPEPKLIVYMDGEAVNIIEPKEDIVLP